jgi:hypothetical protein
VQGVAFGDDSCFMPAEPASERSERLQKMPRSAPVKAHGAYRTAHSFGKL